MTNFRHNIFEISDIKDNVLEISRQFNPGCTNKMYSREMLLHNQIFQPEHRYYEDVVFWLKAVFNSNKISVISDRLYVYRQRPGSIMNSLTYKHIDDRLEFIKQIDVFVKEKIIPISKKNVTKILDDSLIYILRHFNYGKKLITETNVSNKADIDEYYEKEIVKFSNEHN